MPVIQFDSLDIIPEGLREFAKQPEGTEKFQLDVVPKQKIDEFRDNNIVLSKERDALREKLEPLVKIVGDDPTDFEQHLAELRSVSQRVKDGELKEGRAIEEAVGKRTDDMRKQFNEQLQAEAREKNAWQDRYKLLDVRYRQGLVASAVKDACVAENSGVEPAAIEDIINSSQTVFHVADDGKLVAKQGDMVIYGSDGSSPMTPKEWLAKLKEAKPFYFKASQGGGAGSSSTTRVGDLGKTLQELSKMSAAEKLDLANSRGAKRAA